MPNEQWWIALAESNDPRFYLISHSNQGLGDITDDLFAPIGGGDPYAVGLVMPYFALEHLSSNTVPLEGDPKNPYDWGCRFN